MWSSFRRAIRAVFEFSTWECWAIKVVTSSQRKRNLFSSLILYRYSNFVNRVFWKAFKSSLSSFWRKLMKEGMIDFSTSIELRVPSSDTICSFLL
jgi:hypothetical protein